ncbi:NAD(P)/FAD-dependent oxidoreductase [Mycobacterium sherrisii]|uniref:NADH dehydrogenase n=1 Tax=Mycobacterium sherrisii TaxID=243061 RepID=A0A1E3SXL3_9MYCO|nr:NAD(P)/FAD-dependent oxidoreductase [Mycobacterium sherrisii]MCV7029626.1 NAD(P)/FAD-dependent oxidoreductase [Mycobacterium sherrisii]MEC4763896.1 NAD(P)/FAD-dependent oxidoreductase [Mycobacterium sherrisii]ODR06840.1 NADH dehydrogenase [Mycobacterium sherrisii]ORW83562.1 NADH dehydrogenase [Mycobacterium sherrisii]
MTSIVIVGSGFTGYTCAHQLARILRRKQAKAQITIVSPVDYMLYTPLLPDVAGGVVDARFVAIPLANALKGVRAVRGRVDDVDFAARTVTYCDPEERRHPLPWDRLVLTPGSVTRLFDVPGLATYARGLKTTAEALYLRDHFVEQLELAAIEDDPAVAAARRTVVVVGASYSGTELVAQLRALADAAARQMGFNPAEVRFLLLDTAEQVMPEVGEKLGNAAMEVLRSRGIDVRLGTTLKAAYADHVVLSDDSRIDTHTIAWVTGVTGAPLIEKLGLPTERGRLKVHPDLQVPGHLGVFAAGDAAAVPDLTQPGKITPPTAQHATRQGKVLARNVAASLGYGTSKQYKHRNLGLVVDLGPGYAVANPLNVHLSGLPAKLVTRAYHLCAIPRPLNRWAVSLAYLTDLLFNRSVVSIGLSSQEDAQFTAAEGIPMPKIV